MGVILPPLRRWGQQVHSDGGRQFWVTQHKISSNGLRLYQGRFTLDIRKNFFTEGCEALAESRERVESLEVLKECGDVALRDMDNGHGGVELMLGLVILKVFSNLSNSMIWTFKCPKCCIRHTKILLTVHKQFCALELVWPESTQDRLKKAVMRYTLQCICTYTRKWMYLYWSFVFFFVYRIM